MLLSDIIEYLGYSELYNLHVSKDDDGVIKSVDYPRLISIINMGMIDLHKKFPILYKQVNVQLYEHISTYILDNWYAVQNTTSSATYKYIMDSVSKPFNNDIIKVNRVINEGCCEYPLNDTDNPFSLFTPTYNTIQITYPLKENIIGVEYQAYPEKIPVNTIDTANYYIEFPEYLLEALNAYVAAKYYANLGQDKPEYTQYFQKYELECSRITNLGLVNLDQSQNLRLENNGWV